MVPHKPDRPFQSSELTRRSASKMENAAPFLVTAASCDPAATLPSCWGQAGCRPGGYSCGYRPAELQLMQQHRLPEAPFCGGSENKAANLPQCMSYTACAASSVVQPYKCQVSPQKSENTVINITPVLRIADHCNCSMLQWGADSTLMCPVRTTVPPVLTPLPKMTSFFAEPYSRRAP